MRWYVKPDKSSEANKQLRWISLRDERVEYSILRVKTERQGDLRDWLYYHLTYHPPSGGEFGVHPEGWGADRAFNSLTAAKTAASKHARSLFNG